MTIPSGDIVGEKERTCLALNRIANAISEIAYEAHTLTFVSLQKRPLMKIGQEIVSAASEMDNLLAEGVHLYHEAWPETAPQPDVA